MKRLLFPAFLTVFFVSYLGPIVEGDFFHHLGAGKAILEGTLSPGLFFGQSLGQAALYVVWKLSGFAGIVFMRAGLYALVLFLLYNWMRRAGVGLYERLFYLLIPAHMFLSFPSERPQIFGFLCFPLTAYLLELRRSDEKSRAVYLVPLIIVIWAGAHPTFLLGVAAVWAYFISGLVTGLIKRKPLKPLFPLAVAGLLPALLLALAPGFWGFAGQAAGAFVNPAPYMKSVQEYLSPVAALKLGEIFPAYWLLLGFAAYVILTRARQMAPAHILMLLIFGLLPFKGLRFLPFFTTLVPLVSIYTPSNPKKDSWEDSKALFAGFALVLALWAVFIPRDIRPGISREFPEKAVSFLKTVKPDGGNIFNHQGWAGYLSWSLPDARIFMPVADVSPDMDEAYEKIIWAESSFAFGKPEWSALLDAYGLDIIVMPGMSPVSGEMYPLADALQSDDAWFLVYQDDTANILARATPANQRVITVYSLPKKNIYLQVIAQARRCLGRNIESKTVWRTMGEAYLRLGDAERAQEAYKKSQGL